MMTSDEAAMNAEAEAIYDAIDAIVSKATFNGVSLIGTGVMLQKYWSN